MVFGFLQSSLKQLRELFSFKSLLIVHYHLFMNANFSPSKLTFAHMIILDGKIASAAVRHNLNQKVQKLIQQGKRAPHLVAILVGNDGASETYVASKIKNCKEIGFTSTLLRFTNDLEEKALLNTIQELNNNAEIDGILVQLPLPKQINESTIIQAIDPKKDVDGFHPINAGKLLQGLPCFVPATPLGVTLLLEHYQIETSGKHAVVIGRSNIVGKPMSVLLSSTAKYGNCTVTICHSKTQNIAEICKQADIVVAALGKPGFLQKNMVKQGAIVIDVGITRVADETKKSGFTIKGDAAYKELEEQVFAMSPVPGGVGLMTIAGLLSNTMKAYEDNYLMN